MSLTVIYIHGFNSSPQSKKAQLLKKYLDNNQLVDDQYTLLIPSLPYAPREAIQSLQCLIEEAGDQQILLIGSSLGGYYSIWLAEIYKNCCAVLVNPAVYPYRLLQDWLGENENIYTAQKYCLTTEHIDQLEAIDVPVVSDPDRLLLLTQTGDETLDYKEATEKLLGVEQRVEQGGDHSFVDFEAAIPVALSFAKRCNENKD